MNNEFFQAITWAYLLYIVLPLYVAWGVFWITEKREERRRRKELDELLAKEKERLERLKDELGH
ncbi:hypothetical protein [Arcanobacterium ihumii]|uniref:hypothetical protein n=1 Tax=Arcanobacterium ihumii TaxID=2138162 RepID=UPI000F530B8B|nr:hypothetical protein [Arcanobacterium ihumii]